MASRWRRPTRRPKVDLTATVGSITLPSPIMTAAGTAGHGAELGAYVDLSSLGAMVVKSLAHFRCEGNDPIRVHQTPSGMINSVGLQGPGVDAWLTDELPGLQRAGARVVVSIWGRTVSDYELAAKALAPGCVAGPDPIVAVEVNISCPNTEADPISGQAVMFAHSETMTTEVLEATAVCGRPRWAKLSPNVGTGLADIARAAAAGGADAVTLVNTYFGLSIDPITGRARLGGGGGGVSGPAIRPLAVRAVADVRAACPDLAIVGVGGIRTATDVVEFARAGADAVQVGTATFAEPRTVGRLGTDLARWCANQGVERYADLVGTVRL